MLAPNVWEAPPAAMPVSSDKANTKHTSRQQDWGAKASDRPIPHIQQQRLLGRMGMPDLQDTAMSDQDTLAAHTMDSIAKAVDACHKAFDACNKVSEGFNGTPSAPAIDALSRSLAAMFAVAACRGLGELQDRRVLQASVVRSFTKKIIGNAIGTTRGPQTNPHDTSGDRDHDGENDESLTDGA